jgi:beta-mannanase
MENTRKIELIPITINQKSFYKKATIIDNDSTTELQSYSTIVATYNKETKQFKLNGFYSKTTTKHIKEFANVLNKTYDLQLPLTTKELKKYL